MLLERAGPRPVGVLDSSGGEERGFVWSVDERVEPDVWVGANELYGIDGLD